MNSVLDVSPSYPYSTVSAGVTLVSFWLWSHLWQKALYVIDSFMQLLRHFLPDNFIGQSFLPHHSGGNGSFLAMDPNMGSPGFSTTLVLVPLGPGFIRMHSLTLEANCEPADVGTTTVVVVPSVWN